MIKVYTTDACPYCHALMSWLEDQGVDFEELSAVGVEGITSVPVTEINGKRIVGFDRPAIKKPSKI